MRHYNLMRRGLIQCHKGYQFLLCQEIESPDITGKFHCYWNTSIRGFNALNASGCFYRYSNNNWPGRIVCQDTLADNSTETGWPNFKSSGSQSLFGKSSTIQPSSFYALTIIKI